MTLRSRFAATLVAALVAAPAAFAEPATYVVDATHSGVNFGIRHFVTTVPGQFEEFSGTVVYDPASPATTKVSFTVQAASIDTRNDQRDDHLRSADFFDVANHPTLTFESVSAEAVDPDTLHVTGDLTIHGVTKRVTVPVELHGVMATPMGTRAGFASEFTIDRKDYGIVWNRLLDAGGAVLGDDVKIAISVAAVKEEAAATR